MYSYLIRYFVIACHITLGLGKINETFKEYHNSNMVRWIEDTYTTAYLEVTFKNRFFSIMNTDDRVKYCNEAKDFAGLDAITPITDTQLKFFGGHFNTVVLECKTLPISYLYNEYEDDKGILIMMWDNDFFKYQYEVLITNSEPLLFSKSTSSTDFEDQRIEDNPFSQLKKDEPIQVCVAAKRYLRLLADKDNDAQMVPVLQSDQVELAQLFDFGNEIGDHVALRCPSTPSMYVYFRDPTKLRPKPYSNGLQIVLVQN